jgi:hypothetical protein
VNSAGWPFQADSNAALKVPAGKPANLEFRALACVRIATLRSALPSGSKA